MPETLDTLCEECGEGCYVKVGGSLSDSFIECLECGWQKVLGNDNLEIPKIRPLVNPDWSGLLTMAQELVDQVHSGEYHEDNDWNHYIYEEVMTTIYGDEFFTWLHKLYP